MTFFAFSNKNIEKKVREYIANDPEIREQMERLQAKIYEKYVREQGAES